MHAEFIAGAYFAHGPVTYNQHLAWLEFEFLLYLPERRFFGEQILPVGVEDAVNSRSTVKAKRADLGFLDLRLAKTHHEAFDAASMQKAKERHGSRESVSLSTGS